MIEIKTNKEIISILNNLRYIDEFFLLKTDSIGENI